MVFPVLLYNIDEYFPRVMRAKKTIVIPLLYKKPALGIELETSKQTAYALTRGLFVMLAQPDTPLTYIQSRTQCLQSLTTCLKPAAAF